MQINYEDFHFDEKTGLRYKEEPVSEFNLCLKDKKLSCGSLEGEAVLSGRGDLYRRKASEKRMGGRFKESGFVRDL